MLSELCVCVCVCAIIFLVLFFALVFNVAAECALCYLHNSDALFILPSFVFGFSRFLAVSLQQNQ